MIVSPTNRNTRKFNNIIINDLMPGEALVCDSVDSAILDAEKDEAYFSPQFLNTLHPTGMPPHRLLIKKGAIYMLICTMSVERGLCNGTRFVIHSCDNKFLLVCKQIAGARKGELFCLPRFLLTPTEKGCAFNFSRGQFPIIPAFAMTINKAQGSTVEELGVDLTSDVFSLNQSWSGVCGIFTGQGVAVSACAFARGEVLSQKCGFHTTFQGSFGHGIP